MLPGLADPLDAFEEELARVYPHANANARWVTLLTPSAAEPLASLLDSLAESAEQITDAGGSVDHEPYRSAVALAKLIVQGRWLYAGLLGPDRHTEVERGADLAASDP